MLSNDSIEHYASVMNLELTAIPTVDVIIAFHRDDDFLCEAVQSALDSKNVSLRIIAVDNRLIDSALPICLRDPRIQLVTCTEQGYATALNSALPYLQSEFIAFLNSDDLHSPERLRIQIDALRESKGHVSICNIKKFSEESQVRKNLGDIRVQTFYPQLLLLGFHFTNATWVIKRSVLPQDCYWRPDINHTFADWIFFSDYLLKEDISVIFLNSPMYFQRVHAGQISKKISIETNLSIKEYWMELAKKVNLESINTKFWANLIIPWQLPPVGLKKAPAFLCALIIVRSKLVNLFPDNPDYQEFKVYKKDVTNLLFRRALIGLMGKSLRKILKFTR
jgi:glycosyltransferase involved in cell wall biosynthesis